MNENTAILADMTLVWNEYHWLAHIPDFGLFGKEIEVHVETVNVERVKPHVLQVDLWKKIEGDKQHYFELIREGFFKYYNEVRPQYEQAGPEWIAQMPVLTTKEEIDDLLNLNYISIRWPYGHGTPSVGFSYNCLWDREHGAGIIIQNDEVIDTGGADILLCS